MSVDFVKWLGEPFDVHAINANFALGGLLTPMPEDEIADSDWPTAEAADPIVELNEELHVVPEGESDANPQTESISLEDQRLIASFDETMYLEYTNRRPAFKALQGRFDPFSREHMSRVLEHQSYSGFLKRPVITFKDACDHSILICQFWHDEDQQDKLSEEAPPPPVEPKPPLFNERAHNIEMARLDWKSAVQYRNEEMERLNDMVAEKRLAYQQARSKK